MVALRSAAFVLWFAISLLASAGESHVIQLRRSHAQHTGSNYAHLSSMKPATTPTAKHGLFPGQQPVCSCVISQRVNVDTVEQQTTILHEDEIAV
ncbi:hypothetical protein P175DRAFT_0535114 [Aspergillus ochraceoroseus IBT 24754]|uniref:Secreted protein n=1 Tax=Aspergillus ochraceoroseus IBT 24754 TaxID=1392256 RepID=A0A2T5LPJ7_9EURO|nr:uncharacterized protein P175DRAFT_0535114 [Aspergillus ochraceoroseus IBT 24754]PTU18203.1 hypothetical protein P175DRAFT_0535114 [Aspergillus ochraceoroseus IBT 24754]